MKNSTKARVRAMLRKAEDLLNGRRFAGRSRDGGCIQFAHAISVSQPFKPSATLEGKKHNLREAARRINSVIIGPGQTFSFWHTVGNPNNPRRFTYGRSLHGGVPVKDYGGGLCQASGIMHHLALMGGLEIVERHNHSVDLYDESTRFAPIGTDATVFYGYKDFRVRNRTCHAVRFSLEIGDDSLVARLESEGPISRQELHIDCKEEADGIKNVTITVPSGEVVSVSSYRPLTDGQAH